MMFGSKKPMRSSWTIIESDFDREFRRARRFHRVFSIVVLSLIALIYVGTATAIYKVVTEPEIVGEFVGKMVSGYKTETRLHGRATPHTSRV